jgi:sigma-B regulation protein RsbU (phosphoserine phosphatase)
LDYRALLKNVERTLLAVKGSEDVRTTIAHVGEAVVRNFRNELGIAGGRLYVQEGGEYVLDRGFGRSRKVAPGLRVSSHYGPVRRAEEDGLVLTDLDDPSIDRELEESLGVTRFAAVSFGEGRFLLSFDVHKRVRGDDLLISLGIIRSVLDAKVKTDRLESLLHDARRIQQSILPRRTPAVADYDVWGTTEPAEIVGGDFYDFIPVSDRIFGAAIADASGHGLLAALLVRDVYVGLRMGIGGDMKIARTIERLNRIVNKSRLTTKFISLFYGEFETDGEIIYVNAGHPGPILYRAASGAFETLAVTGMVLGPSPDSVYGRRAVKMEAGDVMLLYSDGIVEATDAREREFGVSRVKRLVSELRKRPARELAERVMQAAADWGAGKSPEDDRTVVVIRRTGKPVAPGGTTPPSSPGRPPASGRA